MYLETAIYGNKHIERIKEGILKSIPFFSTLYKKIRVAEHTDFGRKAEELAVKYLQEKGYNILARNYIYRKGEIDIIAQKGDILAVVEVKARSSAVFGNPEQFVNKRKIELITRTVDHFIEENNLDVEVRFDIMAILRSNDGHSINYIEDAFYYF